jgi:hypothetical protein
MATPRSIYARVDHSAVTAVSVAVQGPRKHSEKSCSGRYELQTLLSPVFFVVRMVNFSNGGKGEGRKRIEQLTKGVPLA